MRRKIVVIVMFAALYGCASIELGKTFDPVAFEASVERGVTTEADVRAMLGEPVSKGRIVDVNGHEYTRWLYYYGKGRPPKFADTQFKMLEVKFDQQQRVQGYNWSSNQP